MGATARQELKAQLAAKTGKRSGGKRSIHGLATETLKITRADYYQSLSGTWLSVEAKSSAAQGNAAVPPGSPGCPATTSPWPAGSTADRRPARAGVTRPAARLR